jgi:hypothetical protein
MKKLFLGVICSLSLVCLFSACPDPEVSGTYPIMGTITATPQTAKNGDVIQLSLGGNLAVTMGASVNGKELVTTLSYYIDGEKVAESTDWEKGYQCTYTVKDLSVGSHEITAHCTANFKDYEIIENLTPGTLEILE